MSVRLAAIVLLSISVLTAVLSGCGASPERPPPGYTASFAVAAGPDCATGSCGLQRAEHEAVQSRAPPRIDMRRIAAGRDIRVEVGPSFIRPGILVLQKGVSTRLRFQRSGDAAERLLEIGAYGIRVRLEAAVTTMDVDPVFDFLIRIEGGEPAAFVKVTSGPARPSRREIRRLVRDYLTLTSTPPAQAP